MNNTETRRKLEGPKRSALRGVAAALSAGSKMTTSIDMKGAVQAAISFAKDMFPQAKDIRLEEVEAASGGWSVVLSFLSGEPGTVAQIMGGSARLFKTIIIDSKSGNAQSLKVWK